MADPDADADGDADADAKAGGPIEEGSGVADGSAQRAARRSLKHSLRTLAFVVRQPASALATSRSVGGVPGRLLGTPFLHAANDRSVSSARAGSGWLGTHAAHAVRTPPSYPQNMYTTSPHLTIRLRPSPCSSSQKCEGCCSCWHASAGPCARGLSMSCWFLWQREATGPPPHRP